MLPSRSSYVVEDGGQTGAKASITRLNAPALPYTHVPGSLKQVRGNYAISRKRARQAHSPAAKPPGKPARSAFDSLPNFRPSVNNCARGMTSGPTSHNHLPSWLNSPGDMPPITRAQSMQHIPGPLSPMMLAMGDVLSKSVPGPLHNPLDNYQLPDAERAASVQSLLCDKVYSTTLSSTLDSHFYRKACHICLSDPSNFHALERINMRQPGHPCTAAICFSRTPRFTSTIVP